MLNPSFPKSSITFDDRSYIAPDDIILNTLQGNYEFDAGEEFRLQDVYGDEIWLKLAMAGIRPTDFSALSVLEVCGGGGFLTYHLLKRALPEEFTINDISQSELSQSEKLISTHYPTVPVEYVVGDMHEVDFKGKFDLIIGNSFLHHFHNVPSVLLRFKSLLNEGGVFISLHEPTPMSTVVEGAKMMAFPLTVIAPRLVNDIVRARYTEPPSVTDIWMFEPRELKKIARQAGFGAVELFSWHFLRQFVVAKMRLHLSAKKPILSSREERVLRRAIRVDSMLNKILPSRFFGSVCLVCKK